jgi:hypothetical protein
VAIGIEFGADAAMAGMESACAQTVHHALKLELPM